MPTLIAILHWWHSFLDIATSFVHVIFNSRTLSDIMGYLQGVQMKLAMLVNSRKNDVMDVTSSLLSRDAVK